MSGLLLLVVMGVQLGLSNAMAARMDACPAAAELAGARRLGGRVARVLRSLIERGEAAWCRGLGGEEPERALAGAFAAGRATPRPGLALGEWVLDLPPPARSA